MVYDGILFCYYQFYIFHDLLDHNYIFTVSRGNVVGIASACGLGDQAVGV
jgi:hypothetical protein